MKIETKLKKTLSKIKLSKNEKVLVALSGGKDSSVVAYLLKKFGYDIRGFYINLGIGKYSEKCLRAVKKLCDDLEIKLHVYDLNKEQGKGMKYYWSKNKKLNHCAVCGVIKKWILNKEARRLKVGKIATGHNFDDEAQTFLMNVLKGSPELSANSGAITKNVRDKKFVPRIKPLFYVSEDEIRKYTKKNKLLFVEGVCPYRENSYRVQVMEFLDTLSKRDKENIIRNFERLNIKKKNVKINYCEKCGEPSRGEVCRMCELVGK